MRILHLLASPWWTGPAENIAQLALAQRALGHQVSVAVDTLRREVPAEEPIAPRLEALQLLDAGGLTLSVKAPPLETFRDVRRLRKRALDVVHCHFSHDHWIARWGRPKGSVLVRSLHAPRSLRRSMPHADGWTVPFPQLLPALTGKRVALLPALVDASFVPDRNRARGGLRVGMVSTFKPSRRHDLALDAFALLSKERPDARLVLVGDGALESELKARVQRDGLDSMVSFEGYLAGDAFVRMLQSLDVVWILGLGNDWSGRAAAQARACGVRVVSVDEGALASWADAVVEPNAGAIVEATLEGGRRALVPETALEVARRVDALYRR